MGIPMKNDKLPNFTENLQLINQWEFHRESFRYFQENKCLVNLWSLYHSSFSDIYFLKMHTTIDNWHIITLKNHGKTPGTWHFFLALFIFLYKCLFLFSKVCESLGTLCFLLTFPLPSSLPPWSPTLPVMGT